VVLKQQRLVARLAKSERGQHQQQAKHHTDRLPHVPWAFQPSLLQRVGVAAEGVQFAACFFLAHAQ
jgi:hypothetical protein